MGQRLVIDICDNGKKLANAYYHWSAYTSSATEVAQKALDYYMTELEGNPYFEDSKRDKLYKAVRMLAETRAGLEPGKDIKEFNRLFPKLEDDMKIGISDDRNNGLISITEETMSESSSWEEGNITIDIGTKNISFDVIWTDTFSEFGDDNFYDCLEQVISSEDPQEELKKVEDALKEIGAKENYYEDTILKDNYVLKEDWRKILDNKICIIDDYIDFSNIKFEDFYKLEKIFEKVLDNGYYSFKFKDDKDNYIYNMIE